MSLQNNLDEANLHFCTRCGAEVPAYRWNESCGTGDYGEYYDFYCEAPTTDPSPQDAVYDCSHCQTRWRAPGREDTGFVLTCGHFMPMYVSLCGVCGQRNT